MSILIAREVDGFLLWCHLPGCLYGCVETRQEHTCDRFTLATRKLIYSLTYMCKYTRMYVYVFINASVEQCV